MTPRKIASTAIILSGLAVIGAGTTVAVATAAIRSADSPAGFQQIACVEFGQSGTAAGNTMLYDWNDSACPPGTYRVHLAQYPDTDPAPTPTPTVTITPSASPSSSPSPSSSATTPAR